MAQQFDDLRLLPGHNVQLELDSYTTIRDSSFFVGYRRGGSVMVTTPLVKGVALSVKIGTKVKVRFFADKLSSACAFRTEVIHVSTVPFPHLHLAVPNQFELGEVRKAVRARVEVICTLLVKDRQSKQSGIIKDLSINGCRLETVDIVGESGSVMKLGFRLIVVGVEKVVKVSALVRSSTETEDGFVTGVEFMDVKGEDRIAMQAYVMAHLS